MKSESDAQKSKTHFGEVLPAERVELTNFLTHHARLSKVIFPYYITRWAFSLTQLKSEKLLTHTPVHTHTHAHKRIRTAPATRVSKFMRSTYKFCTHLYTAHFVSTPHTPYTHTHTPQLPPIPSTHPHPTRHAVNSIFFAFSLLILYNFSRYVLWFRNSATFSSQHDLILSTQTDHAIRSKN